MEKFHVGDRVCCAVECPDGNKRLHIGMTGTIVNVEPMISSRPLYYVCWDDNVSGHDCGGHCAPGHGWNVWEEEIGNDPGEIPEPDLAELESILFG